MSDLHELLQQQEGVAGRTLRDTLTPEELARFGMWRVFHLLEWRHSSSDGEWRPCGRLPDMMEHQGPVHDKYYRFKR